MTLLPTFVSCPSSVSPESKGWFPSRLEPVDFDAIFHDAAHVNITQKTAKKTMIESVKFEISPKGIKGVSSPFVVSFLDMGSIVGSIVGCSVGNRVGSFVGC